MKAYITLKESFHKKRYSALGAVQAEAKLSNGAEYDVTFILYHELITIVRKGAIEDKAIKEEEKMAIIEEILDKYTTFSIKSLLNLTTSYNIERFKIVEYRSSDICSVNDIKVLQGLASPEDILISYVKSEYSKTSFSPVFRAMNTIYNQIVKKQNEINLAIKNGAEDTKLNIVLGYQLNKREIVDVKYYTSIILANYIFLKKYKISYDKDETKLNIELD